MLRPTLRARGCPREPMARSTVGAPAQALAAGRAAAAACHAASGLAWSEGAPAAARTLRAAEKAADAAVAQLVDLCAQQAAASPASRRTRGGRRGRARPPSEQWQTEGGADDHGTDDAADGDDRRRRTVEYYILTDAGDDAVDESESEAIEAAAPQEDTVAPLTPARRDGVASANTPAKTRRDDEYLPGYGDGSQEKEQGPTATATANTGDDRPHGQGR